MAINVEILTSYQINGRTYRGSFPIYSSAVTCPISEVVDAQNQYEKDLSTITEYDTFALALCAGQI